MATVWSKTWSDFTGYTTVATTGTVTIVSGPSAARFFKQDGSDGATDAFNDNGAYENAGTTVIAGNSWLFKAQLNTTYNGLSDGAFVGMIDNAAALAFLNSHGFYLFDNKIMMWRGTDTSTCPKTFTANTPIYFKLVVNADGSISGFWSTTGYDGPYENVEYSIVADSFSALGATCHYVLCNLYQSLAAPGSEVKVFETYFTDNGYITNPSSVYIESDPFTSLGKWARRNSFNTTDAFEINAGALRFQRADNGVSFNLVGGTLTRMVVLNKGNVIYCQAKTSVTDTTYLFGLSIVAGLQQAKGVYIQFDSGGNFAIVDDGASTDSMIPYSANTWYDFKFLVNSNATVSCFYRLSTMPGFLPASNGAWISIGTSSTRTFDGNYYSFAFQVRSDFTGTDYAYLDEFYHTSNGLLFNDRAGDTNQSSRLIRRRRHKHI